MANKYNRLKIAARIDPKTGRYLPGSGSAPLVDRFWAKVKKGESDTDCWEWIGAKTNGYGYINLGLDKAWKLGRAHRVAYELLRGEIPPGLHLDHLCRNHSCVNPDHLEPVTNRTNCLRGIGPTAVNARKLQCNMGHNLSGKNLTVRNGQRRCRKCELSRNRRSYSERKARERKEP